MTQEEAYSYFFPEIRDNGQEYYKTCLVYAYTAHLNQYIENKNINIDFEFLSDEILNCNLSGCKRHAKIPLINVYEKLFNEKKKNMEFVFGAGGQFIVSKKNILKRPKSFYLKIIEMLQHNINPIEGYVIERFHSIILK